MNIIKFPNAHVEDSLVNIGALARLGRFVLENAEGDEFPSLKSDLVTVFYLIGDQVTSGENGMGQIARKGGAK